MPHILGQVPWRPASLWTWPARGTRCVAIRRAADEHPGALQVHRDSEPSTGPLATDRRPKYHARRPPDQDAREVTRGPRRGVRRNQRGPSERRRFAARQVACVSSSNAQGATSIREGPGRTVIQRTPGWRLVSLRELWRYRDLLVSFLARDLRLRYRQTALGVVWVALQPLMGAVIFAVVFGIVARLPSNGVPYFVFSLAGLVLWGAFSNTLSRVSFSLLQNAHLVSKVYFPRLLLPIAAALSALVDLAAGTVLLVATMLLFEVPLSAGLLVFPVLGILAMALALSVGLSMAALMVKYRDVQQVLTVLTQLLLYASPVAYPVTAAPAGFRFFFDLNPLTSILEAARWSLFGIGTMPAIGLALTLIVTILMAVAGCLLFRHAERSFADVI